MQDFFFFFIISFFFLFVFVLFYLFVFWGGRESEVQTYSPNILKISIFLQFGLIQTVSLLIKRMSDLR